MSQIECTVVVHLVYTFSLAFLIIYWYFSLSIWEVRWGIWEAAGEWRVLKQQTECENYSMLRAYADPNLHEDPSKW